MRKNLSAIFTMAILGAMSFLIFWHIPQIKAQIHGSETVQDQDTNKDFDKIIRAVNQAVVNIEIKRTINDVISHFSIASGVFVREDGYILTNHHVVEGNEDNLAVHYISASQEHQENYIGDLNAVRQHPRANVKIVNYDPERDLALIKIEGRGFPVIKFGDDPESGDEVFAVGHPLGLLWTATYGNISKKISIPRNFLEFEYFVQTDAATNPGNSGGPLLNMKGEMVGLNTSSIVLKGIPSINTGLNLAIPVGDIKVLLPRLMEEKSLPERSFLGIKFLAPYQQAPKKFKNSAGKNGILIVDIKKGSPAQRADLRIGDIIQSIDEKRIVSFVDFNQAVILQKPGKTIEIKINRQGQLIIFYVYLEKRSDTNVDINIIGAAEEETVEEENAEVIK